MNAAFAARYTQCKAVFFDFGDTIAFNNAPFPQGLWRLLRDLGMETDFSLLSAQILRQDDSMAAQRMAARSEADYRAFRIRYYAELLRALGLGGSASQLPEQIHARIGLYHETYLHPDSLYVLDAIRRAGLTVGIVSNFSHALPALCARLGVTEHVDFIVYSDDECSEKPDSGIFRAALKKSGHSAAETMHIGDSESADVAGALAMGIAPVLISSAHEARDWAVVPNLMGILPLLGLSPFPDGE